MMFGYLKPYGTNVSTINKLYKKYYCSLCHALWNYYGFKARFLLSYDLTFICALFRLNTVEPTSPQRICYEKSEIKDDKEAWKAMAALSLLMVSAKMQDDINDEKSFKAKIISRLYKKAFLKAKRDFPKASKMIETSFEEFGKKEQNHADLYEMAAAFSNIMADAANSMVKCSDKDLAIIHFVSKWVYFIDAVDDIDEDMRKNRFNPFTAIAQSKKQLLTEHADYILDYASSITSELEPFVKEFDLTDETCKLIASVLVESIPYVSYCVFTNTVIRRKTLVMKVAERNGINYV